jgi:hypothetical protein
MTLHFARNGYEGQVILAFGVRAMKLKLAVAFAVLLFTTATQADSVTDDGDVLIIPTDSTIASEYDASVFGMPSGLVASFTLNDGSGTAEGQFMQGDGGEILFSEPVLNLTLTWISTGPGGVWTNTGAAETYPGFSERCCSQDWDWLR